MCQLPVAGVSWDTEKIEDLPVQMKKKNKSNNEISRILDHIVTDYALLYTCIHNQLKLQGKETK